MITSPRDAAACPPGTLTVVLKGYPRLSETFIAQELRGLELAGFKLAIVALRRPTDRVRHPIHDEITAPVHYLPEYLHDAPLRVLRAAWRARRRPGFARAARTWLRDFARDPTRNRARRFGQALVLADELPSGTNRLHAHFIHTPASVTRYAALLTGLPWTISAHAKDIWTSPDWDLADKLADADWTVTCSAAAVARLAALASDPDRVALIYHGLDFERFPAPPARPDVIGAPTRLLSIGRLVPKKGFDVLLRALAMLPAALEWRLTHVGGGGDAALRALAAELGLADRVEWRGSAAQEEVLRQYRAADVFVLASRVAGDGDRDGLPNVLLEAQSQGLACVSTAVSAIPELILDGETGLLAPPDDPAALAAALASVIADPALRRRLGAAGQARVRARFGHATGLERLAEKFRATAR